MRVKWAETGGLVLLVSRTNSGVENQALLAEFANRFDGIIEFKGSQQKILQIVDLMLDDVNKRLSNNIHLDNNKKVKKTEAVYDPK